MSYLFSRTFCRPSSGTGAVIPSERDAFSDRIWRGVGAGDEDFETTQPDIWKSFFFGSALGVLVVGAYSFTKWGPVGHLQKTIDGMKGVFTPKAST